VAPESPELAGGHELSRYPTRVFNSPHIVLAGAILLLFCAFAGNTTLQVTPDEACVGQTVLLRVTKAGFEDIQAIDVTIAGQIAPVVRILDPETIEVMVPVVPIGKAPIQLSYHSKPLAMGAVMIIPAPMRRIFLRMERDSVTVERTSPYYGQYDRNATTGRRLSFDVISEKGQLLYTGAMPHPVTGTYEVFGPAGSPYPHRVPAEEPYRFMIKIPYSPGTTIVRVYEVPAGVDLSSDTGRQARRLINEFEVSEKP
jgi:hypothetical protein